MPTVVSYKMNALTYRIVRRLVKVDYAHLLNIMARRQIVPEYLQAYCTPQNLGPELLALLGDSGPKQVADLSPYLSQLQAHDGDGTVIDAKIAAAKAVLSA